MSQGGQVETESSHSWAGLLWVALLAYFILMGYGVASAAVDSLLLHDYGDQGMKYAYGAVALAVTIVVPFYAKAASRYAIGTLFQLACGVSTLLLIAFLSGRYLGIKASTYALYVWKDIYVIVLVELVWTLANSAFKTSTAKWNYGFFCAAGTIGTMSGSALAQYLARPLGSAQLLWLCVPVFIAIALVGPIACRACGWPEPPSKEKIRNLFGILRSSRSVQLLLLLVATIQIATTLIDYNYKVSAHAFFPLVDDRTAAFGRVDMAISSISLGLQLFSGVFATLLGLRLLVLILPLIVGAVATYHAIWPSFASIAALKITNKSIDYSLFRTSKELLYRPLSYDEKTQGKAAVDVFGYRVAKGGASALLVAFSGALSLVAIASIAGIGIWLLLATLLTARVNRK